MERALFVLLIIVGLINFAPVMGVISADKLSQAYAIELPGNDIVILLRHRALLFGIVGGFILCSAFTPSYRTPAMAMAAVSMVGYLFFMWHEGDYNAALNKVMLIDVVGIVCLVGAAVLKYFVLARS